MTTTSPNLAAAEQLLQSIPNPDRLKEVTFHLVYHTPGGNGSNHAIIWILASLVAMVLIVTVGCVIHYRGRR